MPVHVENLTTEVTLAEGDIPLSEAQVEALVSRVLQRIEERERATRDHEEATGIRECATPVLFD